MKLYSRLLELLLISFFLFVAAGCPVKKSGRTAEVALPADVGQLYEELGFEYAGLKEAEEEILALRDSAGVLPRQQLMALLSLDPSTFDYDFTLLCDSSDFYVNESDDKNVRFYGWTVASADSLPRWDNLIQFRTANKIYVYRGSAVDFSEFSSDVPSGTGPVGNVPVIELADGSRGYLVRVRRNESPDLECSTLVALTIDGGELVPVEVFDKDADGGNVSTRKYNLKRWKQRSGINPDALYNYDRNVKSVYIPEVEGDDPIGQFSIYVLENGRFNFAGVDGGFWIHPSIRSFKRLEVMFATRQFMVRIDRMPDDSYRYASWSDETDMIGQPDIILTDGAYDPDTNTYTFTNGSFEYRIHPWAPVDELTVYQNGEKILSETRILK